MTLDFDRALTKTVAGARVAAKKAAKTANDVIDYTKLQIDRAAIRDHIREVYLELGRLTYAELGGEDCKSEIRECKVKLDELFLALNSAERKKSGCKVCGFCHASNPSDGVFCSKCGEKL